MWGGAGYVILDLNVSRFDATRCSGGLGWYVSVRWSCPVFNSLGPGVSMGPETTSGTQVANGSPSSEQRLMKS